MENICSRLKGLSEHQEHVKEANARYSLAKVLTCPHKEKHSSQASSKKIQAACRSTDLAALGPGRHSSASHSRV